MSSAESSLIGFKAYSERDVYEKYPVTKNKHKKDEMLLKVRSIMRKNGYKRIERVDIHPSLAGDWVIKFADEDDSFYIVGYANPDQGIMVISKPDRKLIHFE